MIVEEVLEWVDGHWVREDEHSVHPHTHSFEDYVARYKARGIIVTDAPDLAGAILDQDGGRPFRLFKLNTMGSRENNGLGAAPLCVLAWETECHRLAPGTVLPPEGQVLTFATVRSGANRDRTPPGRAKPWSWQSQQREWVIAGPYPPAEGARPPGEAPGGRRSRRARRRPRA